MTHTTPTFRVKRHDSLTFEGETATIKVQMHFLRIFWITVKTYVVEDPDAYPEDLAYAQLCAAELLEKLQADETV